MKKEALDFLRKNNSAVIATAYKNIPFAATIHYIVDSNYNFYFITKRKSDKYLNLALNPAVALVIGSGPKHISVQAKGQAFILEGKEKEVAAKKILAIFKKGGIKKWPMHDMKRFQSDGTILTTEVVIKIVPDNVDFMNLDDKSYPKSLSNEYHAIIDKKA